MLEFIDPLFAMSLSYLSGLSGVIVKKTSIVSSKNTQTSLHSYQENVRKYVSAGTSDNTRKTYRSAIRQFEKWGGRLPCDSDVLMRYALDKVEHINPRTLDLHMTALSQWHKQQGIADPTQNVTLKKTLEGMRRVHVQPIVKAKPLQLNDVIRLLNYLETLPHNLKKYRDTALILTAFMGAFRRSELINIMVADLQWEDDGLIINMPSSKTDQEGKGSTRALPYSPTTACAASAIRQWIDTAGITEGPIFRSINRWDQVGDNGLYAGSVNTILKDRAAEAGLTNASAFSSHSFRRGHATSAARAGVDFRLIKKQGGWRSDSTVHRYIEDGNALTDNSSLALMQEIALKAKSEGRE